MDIATLGLVGTGAMGSGIARLAAEAGMQVLLFDARPGAADSAIATITGQLAATPEQDAAAIRSRLRSVEALSGLAPAQVVVEAIDEHLESKQQLFAALEAVVTPDCILASNSFSLSITALAAACQRPERVAGFHFFNPAPAMKIVEVVDGLLTAPAVGDALLALGQRLGHTAVRAKDSPGFIVNHAGRAYIAEGLRLIGENVADVPAIDRIMRESAGFPHGPLELLDLIGIDVFQPAQESIYQQYFQDPRFRPSHLTRQYLAAGLLGRKSGRGFYRYDGDRVVGPAAALEESKAPALVLAALPPLWISQAHPEFGRAVSELVTRLGAIVETGLRPSAKALCIVTPRGLDASSCADREGLDAHRTIAVDVLFGLEPGRRRTLMTTPVTSAATRQAAHGLFAADGSKVTVIRDSAGFVAQRVVAHMVNVACDIAQQGIATPTDIDRAVTLGLGCPHGPLGLGDAIGPKRILDILDCLFTVYRDPRYRPSPWLRRRALLGASLLTGEL
ncbi:3-hydroxyacyl-CoA dehydrogenase [Denitratisoma sp. agr-D3]